MNSVVPGVRRWGWFAAGVAVGLVSAAGAIAWHRDWQTPPPRPHGLKLMSEVLWQRPGVLWEEPERAADVTLTLPDGATVVLHRDGQTLTVRDANNTELWSKNVVLENNLRRSYYKGAPTKTYISSVRSPSRHDRTKEHRPLDSQDDKDYYGISFINKEWGFINYKTSKYYSTGSRANASNRP